ncbi:MAG: hypothetical protein FWC64_13580, partial [Treponema sp.]|nr:hypothetical protein [Treponema sp.]
MNRYAAQIQAVFKRFSVNEQVLEHIISSGVHVDNLLGNREHTEDIEKGYVYIFTRNNRAEVEHTIHRIRGARMLVPIPSEERGMRVYYAYSRIRMSDERLESIKQSIRLHNPPSPPPARVVRIDSEDVLRPKRDTPVRHAPSADGEESTIEIILYDWFGYLEECAAFYKGTVEANYANYERHLEGAVSLSGDFDSAGVRRGDLFAFTDMIDDLVERSERPSLSRLLGGSFRREVDEAAMYSFYNEARETIDTFRSGGLDARLNRTIRLIPALLASRMASATFIDHLHKAEGDGDAPDLVEVISDCLYKWQEVLHRQEREQLLKVWEFPTLFIDEWRMIVLNEHLEEAGGAGATAETFRLMGDSSFFLHFAAGFGVPQGGALPPNAWDIVSAWLSAGLQNNHRLMIYFLFDLGLFKGRPEKELETGVLFRGNDGEPFSGKIFGRTVKALGAADGLELIQVPRIAMSAVERISVLMSFNHFLAQMELSAQMAGARRDALAVPHFLSGVGSGVAAVSGTKALITASKKAFMHGIQVGSFFSALPAMVNAGIAGSTGNTRVALMYGGSGAGYVASGLVAKGVIAKKAGAVFKPWVAVLLAFAGSIINGMANREFMDRIRLAVRHSIWGARNGEMPRRGEGALGAWWPELEEEDGSRVSIEDKILAITFSNRAMDENWHRRLMRPNIGNTGENIRETFNRNSYLLNAATQLPPVTVEAAENNNSTFSHDFFPNYPIR